MLTLLLLLLIIISLLAMGVLAVWPKAQPPLRARSASSRPGHEELKPQLLRFSPGGDSPMLGVVELAPVGSVDWGMWLPSTSTHPWHEGAQPHKGFIGSGASCRQVCGDGTGWGKVLVFSPWNK